MLLAVLSDTHGRAPEAAAALRLLNERDPAAFLHCGDVGDRRRPPDAVLDELARAAAGRPAYVVPGNNDPDRAALRAACEERGIIYGDPVVFTLNGARICGTHGTRGEQADLAADGLERRVLRPGVQRPHAPAGVGGAGVTARTARRS